MSEMERTLRDERTTAIEVAWEELKSRVGKFRLHRRLIFSSHPNVILELFSNMIVVGADADFVTDSIEYIAISPLFERIGEGDMPKEYIARITVEAGVPTHIQWERLK